MNQRFRNKSMPTILGGLPTARANISGDAAHPLLYGNVDFFPHQSGTLVVAELWGLPHDAAKCAPNLFAMHIHAGGSCLAEHNEPFSTAGGHYNPDSCPHPAHAGDLPPLFGNDGYAWQAFYTERFDSREILGKTVIIHSQRDDFKSQPAGDAGGRIGCGVIKSWR